MRSSDFQFVAKLVWKRAAIVVESGKEYLVESRLTPLAEAHGFLTLSAMVDRLRGNAFGNLADAVVEAMITNETSFFRDIHPFLTLRNHVVPEILKYRQEERRIRVWCGAASSGQEPYTIAMVLRDSIPFAQGWTLDFVGTDISRAMLARCDAGLYSQQEVNRGLPPIELMRSFRREGTHWRVKDELRQMVRFEYLNLARPLKGIHDIDIVFLRNVLLYFDAPTKRIVLSKVRQVMRPEAFLFLGTAETMFDIDPAFCRDQHGRAVFYRSIGQRSMAQRSMAQRSFGQRSLGQRSLGQRSIG